MDFATIKNTLAQRDSQELHAIWIEQDAETWTPEAFRAIAEVLRERGEALPRVGGSAADAIRNQRAADLHAVVVERRLKLGSAALHAIAFISALPTAFVCGVLLALLAQVMPIPHKWRTEFAAFGTIGAFFSAWTLYFRILARRFLT